MRDASYKRLLLLRCVFKTLCQVQNKKQYFNIFVHKVTVSFTFKQTRVLFEGLAIVVFITFHVSSGCNAVHYIALDQVHVSR